ncbi:MAG: HupE/UreJ family protein [Porticoccaceae bacterium]|nr:HupE/UreJ family protein [Porticoccaceae bacterium]
MMRAIFLLLSLIYVGNASADEARPVYVEINQLSESEYLLKWKIPPVMPLGEEPGIKLDHESCRIEGGATGNQPAGLLGRRHYVCDQASPDFSVHLNYLDSNPGLTSLVVYKSLSGEVAQVFSGPEITIIALPLDVPATEVAHQYLMAGTEHILEGYDHLLFVLCLIIIAGGLKRLLLTVTGFTLAHSITLSLATLNIFRVRTELVEILIALSILLLAVEIIRHHQGREQNSFTWRYPVSVSSAFGLLHGFGFAVVLQELGLPQSMKLEALLFFNIGVEIGQILFIVGIVLIGLLARQIPAIEQKEKVITDLAVYAIGICSAYWLFDRSALLLG